MTVRGYHQGYRHPNLRGLSVAGFASLTFGAGVSGQLSSNLQTDLGAGAAALPILMFYANPLPTVGGRLIGFEVHLHAVGGTGQVTNWHVAVNGVVIAAFNLSLGAADRRGSIWPAAGVDFAAVSPNNYLSVTFDMAAPIAGNFRPSAVVFYETNATAPAP